ncbi:MAG: transcriptional regulator, PadR-like family [Solirubrobacterales bacterium]|nr:transcriptional regulator, PadR-like family [Solirubrobacterales bacterium]
MSLRHALLGLLTVNPGTGYELTQRFDRSLSNAWHASHSQIYPELARLDEAGFAEVVSEGARGSRTWAVTDAGREELRRWLTESEPNRSVRNEGAVRLFLLTLLDPADRRPVLERERAHIEEEHRQLRALAAELDALPEPAAFRPVIDLALRLGPVMAEWMTEQLEDG